MPHQDPPPISTLIFSSAASNFSHILTQLRRRNLSIGNHLRSIDADAQFIEAVSTAYNRPLVANERCGSWYIPPNRKHGSCYFKSTDGHIGQWNFSLRRLNLHLLKIIRDGDGYGFVSRARLRYMLREKNRCIIVDSTRRGKSVFESSVMEEFPLFPFFF